MSDVYYSPEKYGLKQVAEIDYSGEPYEFDLRVVWLHGETGVFYTARDSGCSCPSPFENYNSLESLDRLDLEEIRAEARRENSGGLIDFLAEIDKALAEAKPKRKARASR